MSGRRWLSVLALAAAGASVACSDSVGPATPLPRKASLATPTGASLGRYILISGVVTCVEDCASDSGLAPKQQGLPPTSPDTLPTRVLSAPTFIAP